jgi:c-di-GMP-binding flagellar brake protein YcgR
MNNFGVSDRMRDTEEVDGINSVSLTAGRKAQVFIASEDYSTPYFTSLIDAEPLQFLRFEPARTASGRPLSLREGETIKVRTFTRTSVCAFNVAVMYPGRDSLSFFETTFPEQSSCTRLRAALRVKTHLNCRVKRSGQELRPATLINLSTSGAALLIDKRFAGPDEALEISFPLKSRFDDMQINVATNAVVRYVRNESASGEGDSAEYGIQFVDLDSNYYFELQNAVYEALVDGMQASAQ